MTEDEQLLKELIKLVKKQNKLLRRRADNMIKLGIVKLIKDGNTQKLQVKTANNEILDNVAFLEPYGLTCKPIMDSETLTLSVQGNAANQVVLNVGSRSLRFKALNSGEVCIYDNSGNRIHLKNGGHMDLIAPAAVNIITKTAKIQAEETTIESQIAAIKANTVTIEAAETITSGKTKLAGGGIGVALLGCTVEVDPNTHKGIITSASTEVTAK